MLRTPQQGMSPLASHSSRGPTRGQRMAKPAAAWAAPAASCCVAASGLTPAAQGPTAVLTVMVMKAFSAVCPNHPSVTVENGRCG